MIYPPARRIARLMAKHQRRAQAAMARQLATVSLAVEAMAAQTNKAAAAFSRLVSDMARRRAKAAGAPR